MDLDQLQSVRDHERRTDKLQQLRESFYADSAELIARLRAERDEAAAAADDPFDDPRVTRLSDQITTAERTVEAIYEKRVGKLVKAASFAAADMPAETEGMTTEEQELFDALVANIRTNRRRVLDGIVDEVAGDDAIDRGGDEEAVADSAPGPTQRPGDTPSDDGPSPPPAPPDEPAPADRENGDSDGGETTPPESSQGGGTQDAAASPQDGDDGDTVDRTTVRITADVGEIFGVDDREYHLETDDVVTLPAANAQPLLERDAAERIE